MTAAPRIFHLLQRAHGALFRAADRRLQAAEGVTATQHSVLLALSRDDGQPISAIADSLKMGKSSLTGLVDRMAADGLVRREIDADDLRVQRIFIERRGRGIVARTLGDVKRFNEDLLKPFTSSERQTIERFLTHVADEASRVVEGATEKAAERKKSA